jgi:putative peptidoglycan lipid II flippase
MTTKTPQGSMGKLLGSSARMAVATLLSRILGLVREQLMALYFGASGLTDAFNVAYRIPNLLRDLFAEGAFSSAFVPIFTDVKINLGKEEARKLLWSSFVLLGLVTGIIVIFIFLFTHEIVYLFAPTFKNDPHKFHLTVVLVRIMAPFLTLVSLAALAMGALNSLKLFFLPSLAPAAFNIILIVTMIYFPALLTHYGYEPIYALGLGVLIGGIVQLVVQLPPLWKNAYAPTKEITLLSPHSKKMLNRMGVGIVGIAGNQINLLVSTILATSSVEGAVSWLFYGFRLFQFPLGVLGISVAGSHLVHFSDAWKSGRIDEAESTLRSSFILSLTVMIPSAICLYVLAEPITQIIYERGAFTASDSAMTSLALKLYLIGLPFYGIHKMAVPTFYVLDKPKIPVIISLTGIGLNLIFCLVMTPIYGFAMLALGTSLIMIFNALSQCFFLVRLMKISAATFINLRFFKLLAAGALCVVVLLGAKYLLLSDPLPFWQNLTRTTLCGSFGLAAYFIMLILLGERQVLSLFARIKKKL